MLPDRIRADLSFRSFQRLTAPMSNRSTISFSTNHNSQRSLNALYAKLSVSFPAVRPSWLSGKSQAKRETRGPPPAKDEESSTLLMTILSGGASVRIKPASEIRLRCGGTSIRRHKSWAEGVKYYRLMAADPPTNRCLVAIQTRNNEDNVEQAIMKALIQDDHELPDIPRVLPVFPLIQCFQI